MTKTDRRLLLAVRSANYWHAVAQRRIRLAVLTFVLGLVLGFVFHIVIAAPPVWIDDVTAAAAQCGAL